jgi:hypothetical protein
VLECSHVHKERQSNEVLAFDGACDRAGLQRVLE